MILREFATPSINFNNLKKKKGGGRGGLFMYTYVFVHAQNPSKISGYTILHDILCSRTNQKKKGGQGIP